MKEKLGTAPGTLIYTGVHKNEPIETQFISYNGDFIAETTHSSYQREEFDLRENAVNWINVTGLHDQSVIAKLGTDFNIHLLALEDTLNTSELPKSEEFEDHLLFTLKMLSVQDGIETTEPEHVSLILGRNFLISLQEKKGDVFEGVRNRVRNKHGRIRARGNDYLLYALLDTIVDNYFLIVDAYQTKIDQLEIRILSQEDENALNSINDLKKQLIRLRKFIQPLEIAVQDIMKFESEFVDESIWHFFEDLRGHISHISLLVNEQRDSLKSLTDLHISLLSNEMNKIMKVLTIVAAIFIPLTFLAGIYGMNFEYMPELKLPWAYPTLLSLMLLTGILLIVFFKRKKWL